MKPDSYIPIYSRDWKKLAQFYINVFNCEPVYPERDLSGNWIEKLTKIPGAHIGGIHLKLPGYQDGPTLEIFQYNRFTGRKSEPLINDQGFGHIAFHVTDVEAMMKKLSDHGEWHTESWLKRTFRESEP